MFSMFGRAAAPQQGLRMSDSSVTFCGPCGPVYDVLRHFKVHLVQHDILWPRGRIAKAELYRRYLLIYFLNRKYVSAPHFTEHGSA